MVICREYITLQLGESSFLNKHVVSTPTIRKIKVEQKISHGFSSIAGADAFAVIRYGHYR